MNYRNFRVALLACTAISGLTASGAAVAQETQAAADSPVLSTIVVKTTGKTARQKLQEGAADTPLASTTTAQTLREKEIGSIKDLGNTTEPGVDFVDTKPGKPGGLYIRGLGQSRVVTLVDGIPIPYFENFARAGTATSSFSDSNSSFDFSSLSTVDVLRGADSSRAGSGALGGALVLRTLEPEDVIGEGRDWGAITKSGFDSRDKSFGGSVAVAKKIQNTSILFQGAYQRGDESRTKGDVNVIGPTRTKANPADYDQNNLLFKLRQDLEGGHRVGVTLERFERDTDTDLLTLHNTYFPYTGWDDTLRERVSLDYGYEAQSADALIDAAQFTAYWQRLSKEAGSEGNVISSGAAYEREDSYRQSAFGLTGGFISSFESGSLDHTVRVGGNFETFDFKEYLYALGGTSSADMPKVEGNRLGLYVEDEVAFAETGFKLTPGLRFDWYDYDPSGSTSTNSGYNTFGLPKGQDGSRFSPKLLASYDVTPELQVFAQWSTAYRAPTVNELYLNFSNISSGYAVLGNSDLKPETSNGFEIGAKYEGDDLTAGLNLFHNRYRNYILNESTTTDLFTSPWTGGQGTLFQYRNVARVEISGVEAKIRKEFANGFFTHASLAYAYGKNKEDGTLLSSVAPFKSIVGIGYEQESWGTELTGIYSSRARDDNKTTTYDAPAYAIANLTGWWEPEQVKGLRVQAGVYNIFDKKYWNAIAARDVNPGSNSVVNANQPVDFYSEAGRTFKISLTKRF
ncbi:TonB-dependent hemoglobin/transferrin/lactoferrin family receptor [Rhizobiaceae bacterium BDR2-2]|uniref:TonB-dependent hemoglobin/transferrin/lactoferrin family receptor n=1 Tax=Ectorhizobium quercum TaxID=2965071 RepID=A0AAE3MX83_9HYPH|nr:TonB-dependent hemoglobin/transferrin/lactoferrin family receptor [Ectorhizobium quercum]MCX8996619.1 TonB-dependent hemoglobin/transferrin/lactoferrin family receptor [Ectorhizobium quercum]